MPYQKQVQIQQPAQQIRQPQEHYYVQPKKAALATERRTSGHVTRVLGDLMVFAEVDENGPLGLVFMPDVIVNYHGERLQEIGIVVGAQLSEIIWDTETRLVSSVVVRATGAPFRAA
jgi:hypothetical protein